MGIWPAQTARGLFVTHGESYIARHFADFLKEKTGRKTSMSGYQNEVALD